MVLDFKKWQKISGLNFYYVGKWAEEGEYVNKYRMIFLSRADYEKISSVSSDEKIIKIDFGNGREECKLILYAELFRHEVDGV